MKKISLYATVLLLLSIGAAQAAQETVGGEIVMLRGAATVTQSGQTVRLYRGASVLVGDQLRTGKNARLKLRMVDGTEITLGENTEFFVRQYDVTENSGKGFLELTKGFFRAITGKITKLPENSFRVKTPLAIVGVRGTDFWGEQQPNKLRIAMLGGTAITVTNDAGSVEITEAGVGTEVTSATEPPKAPFRWSPDALKRAAGTVQ